MNRETFIKPKYIPVILIRLFSLVLLIGFPLTVTVIALVHFFKQKYFRDIFVELIQSIIAKYE